MSWCQVLPYTSLAAVVRVCIALVGLCSYPLCIVPLGDSIEAVIPWRTHREAKRPPFSLSPSACKSPSFHSTKYSSIVDEGGSSSYQTSVPETVARARRLAVRLSIVASTLICANVVGRWVGPAPSRPLVGKRQKGGSVRWLNADSLIIPPSCVAHIPVAVACLLRDSGPVLRYRRGADWGVHGDYHLIRPPSPLPPHPLQQPAKAQ